MNTKKSKFNRLLKMFPAVIILALGLALSLWFVKTKPKAKVRPKSRQLPIVKVAPLSATPHRVELEAMGTVVPAVEASLRAQVGGTVVWVHPSLASGARFAEGELLVRLDPSDYELALASAEADLKSVQASLKLEQGQQDIAKAEWKLLGTADRPDVNAELALRQPQLEASQAAVQRAQAAVDKAKLNLARTELRAPFDAVILEDEVDAGDYATAGSVLLTLASTREYWVELSVKPSDLQWLEWPNSDAGTMGSEAIISAHSGGAWTGRLTRLRPRLSTAGRMARVVAAVPDPITGSDPSKYLLLGSFVRVVLEGTEINNTVELPRAWLREGDLVWVLDTDKRLHVLPFTVLWSEEDSVYGRMDIPEGGRIITSALSAPVAGMELSLEGEKAVGRKPEPETAP